ncbi:Uncharacterised protein [Candidatus Anstonella stagnisolia]|nr:Uncharacterised protein [Candidatus Anstonella stagnisolia]
MRLPFLLLLLHFSFAAAAGAEEGGIFNATHSLNVQIAPSLLGSQRNLANAQESIPSLSDPFSFAYVRVLSADPSVDFRISSAKNASIIWAWGEMHAQEISQSIDFDSRCAPGKTTILQNGSPWGDFIAHFSLEGPLPLEKSMRISDNGYFSPPFSQEEFDRAEINEPNSSLPLLHVQINGTISARYGKREEKNLYVCETTCSKYGCATSCGCEKEVSLSSQTFSRALFGEKSFPLENKPARFFVLSPILLEQLATSGKFSVLSFSNRIFAKANFNPSNSPHIASLLGLESLRDPQYGFACIKSREDPSNEENFSFSCARNATRMLQLSGGNSTLLYSCTVSFNETSPQLGMLNSSLLLHDSFGDAYPFSFSSLSRNYTSQIPQGTPLSNGAQYFSGNLTHRPATGLTMLASHRNSDFSSFFQNGWMLLLLFLLLFPLWRFLRP